MWAFVLRQQGTFSVSEQEFYFEKVKIIEIDLIH